MASRRTRIKGIANIPQRRKTLNNTNNPEDKPEQVSQLEDAKNIEHNLNLEHEISAGDSQKEESLTTKNQENDEIVNTATKDDVNNVVNEGCQPPHVPEIKPLDDNTAAELPNETTHVKVEVKPTVPTIRRRFIKPAVSLNAISRKAKDAEETKSIVVTNPVNGRNNKIIILNEVISFPNIGKPVVIENHKVSDKVEDPVVSEAQDQALKSPEINVEKQTSGNSLERDIKRLPPVSPQILTPELEYPIPPPSPNKINRSRIKAVPRLGQRNTSFSASESEDETRRNYRHRNDSVCSSTSGIQDTSSIPECPSPQKPREFNSVIQRKCRRTEQSRKLAEARRDFYLKFGNKTPDRQKLTMIDLIFYNPGTNTMSSENKPKRKISETVENEIIEKKAVEEEEEAVDDPGKTGSDEENEIPAPQIKIGPQGELVVDEQSLVIENKSVKKSREALQKAEVVNADFETCYGIYKRAKRSKDWSKQETLKFYKALNTIGTDFTLMCELFPRRSRRELKMKFKKEERVNKALIDKAIMQPCNFDFNDFKHEVEMEEKELHELEKQKEREKMLKQEAKKRKAAKELPKLEKSKTKKKKRSFDIMNVLEADSDADESEVESLDNDEPEDTLMQTIQKPTRSGRVPKVLNRYKAPKPEFKYKAQSPGSLVVVTSAGPNGQPVWKVCMVTGEHSRQEIRDDITSLEEALECKENGLTSLFTLSAAPAEENNVTIPAEENNTTTPAEEEIYDGDLQIDLEV